MTDVTVCPRCDHGTWTDANGRSWRCHACQGTGKIRPLAVVIFELHNGEVLERTFTALDHNGRLPMWLKEPPEFLEHPTREWVNPHEPLTLRGRVAQGHEAEARRVIYG